jgi:putative oxidoreductase
MSDQSEKSYYVPAMAGFYAAVQDLAYPMVRIASGLILIPHGAQKLFGMFGGNINGTAGFFTKVGLEPALPLAYLVGGVEFFGGILIAIGLYTRIAAAGSVILLLVAAIQVHMIFLDKGFFWTKLGYEYPLLWAILNLAIFFRGGGKFSVDSKMSKEF